MIDSAALPLPFRDLDVNAKDRLTRYFLDVRDDLLRFLTRKTGHIAAEDIVQDVWLNLHERGDPASWREPRAVIFTTAAHLAIDRRRLRDTADKYFSTQPSREDVPCPRPGPEAQAEAVSNLERLYSALMTLPQPCREAFLLNRLDAMTHVQIARRLGVSTKSVQRYIERALRHCGQALGQVSAGES